MKKLGRLFGKNLPLDLNFGNGTAEENTTLTTPLLALFRSNRAPSNTVFSQLSPIILEKIFLHFVNSKRGTLSHTPPWVLGQVCRRWRAIALATPDLWAHLPSILLGTLTKHDVDRIFTCLSELLRRCSGIPITFFLRNEITDPMDYPIIDLLVAHCGQWEDVSLEVSGITIRRFFKTEGQLNSLHSLEFSLRGRGEPIVKLFESAPRLQTVRVNDLVSPGMLRLPWMQLTSYEDRTAFGDGVSKAFQSDINLQHLKFSPSRDEELDFLPQIQWKPLVMPHLTTLTIEFWAKRYKMQTLFDSLTLPALHTLVLKFSKHDIVMGVELVNMISRSLCDLKHLTFHGRNSPILQFLAVMPSLMTLDINDPDTELLEKLSQFQGGEWTVVPCLQSITIHISELPQAVFDYRYLATLSRLAGIRCDTVSAFRDDQPSLSMLRTFKVAFHGTEDVCLGHFYYSSLEPPTTEMELWSANRIAEIYTSMMNNPLILHPSSSITPSELIGAHQSLVSSSSDDLPRAWDRRRQNYADVMTDLKNLLESDPEAVAGVYVRTQILDPIHR